MPIRTTQERWEKLILHRDLIIQEANLKGAEIPLNADYPEIILGLQRITLGLPEAEVESLLDVILGEVVVGDYSVKGQAILDEKEAIRQAIIGKEVEVPVGTPLNEYPAKIAAIETGGGAGTGPIRVRFVDFDGTILKEERLEVGGSATAPPIPAHEKLIFNRWNNSFEALTRSVDVGALYDTVDDATYIKLVAGQSGITTLSFNMSLTKIDEGDMYVDVGEGTPILVTGTGVKSIPWVYTTSGEYTIKINFSGRYSIGSSLIDTNTSVLYIYASKYAEIRDYGFSGMTQLKKVSIINMASASAGVFRNCRSLRAAILPDTISTIGYYQFDYCRSLEAVVIPDTTINFRGYAFSTCTSLTSIVLPRQATGPVHFDGCTALTDVLKSETPQDYSFSGCRSLKEYEALEGVSFVLNSAFSACFSLRKVILPSSLTSIGSGAFSECEALKALIVLATTPPTAPTNLVHSLSKLLKIYVPDDSVSAYKDATNWNLFGAYVFPISQYQEE